MIGHEIVHSTQYDQYGFLGLATPYNNANSDNLKKGMNAYDAYRNNLFEVAGWDMGAKIKNDIQKGEANGQCGYVVR